MKNSKQVTNDAVVSFSNLSKNVICIFIVFLTLKP